MECSSYSMRSPTFRRAIPAPPPSIPPPGMSWPRCRSRFGAPNVPLGAPKRERQRGHDMPGGGIDGGGAGIARRNVGDLIEYEEHSITLAGHGAAERITARAAA